MTFCVYFDGRALKKRSKRASSTNLYAHPAVKQSDTLRVLFRAGCLKSHAQGVHIVPYQRVLFRASLESDGSDLLKPIS